MHKETGFWLGLDNQENDEYGGTDFNKNIF